MASLILPAASITKTTKAQQSQCCFRHSSNVVSFSFSSPWVSKLCFSPKDLQSKRNHSTVVKAQSNEVSIQGLVSNCSYLASLFFESCIDVIIHAVRTSNAMATLEPKLAGPKIGKKDVKQAAALASEASISEFMARVSILVKLVDSRDIVELQLKQSDCELVIRKKEALPQPPPPANNMVMMHSPPTSAVTPSALPPAPPAAVPTPSPASSSTQAPTPPPSAKSSLSPLKCPMAGTFYRSPAPGEPVFVKVGDKVQKGQVVCIIEAMKLMNEIEADRTGTIVEILVDDGKPVSVDLPLFVIEP